jgi:hypothetical protein
VLAVPILLAACVAQQQPAAPVDPSAPFPLENSRIVGQPSPGAILVELPRTVGASVPTAARTWCGGDAQASKITENVDVVVPTSETWLVRCR